MSRYALSLPIDLKHQAEELARQQGVSLNQFILWAVAEKVGALSQQLDDPAFPNITYRRGAGGELKPILRGTSLRVQTIVVAAKHWGMDPQQVAREYDIPLAKVREILTFYAAHQPEIDRAIALDEMLEAEAAHG